MTQYESDLDDLECHKVRCSGRQKELTLQVDIISTTDVILMKHLLDTTLSPIYDFIASDPSSQPLTAVPPFLIILQDILDTLGSLELALPQKYGGVWY